jgi:hypothetical protein
MRKWRWLGLALCVLAGCQSTKPEVKPKYQPELYTLPPANDPRYESMVYPKDTLFQDVIRKEPGPSDPTKMANRFGGGGPGTNPSGF